MDISTSVAQAAETVKALAEPAYTDAERTYLKNIKQRLTVAKEMRSHQFDEFDGMTFSQYCESNRKTANTYIEPKKNKEDTNFVSGTIRQKMFAYLAAVNNLDLQPDVQAFDPQNVEVRQLGEAMEDILFQTNQMDKDDEKRLLRQYSMLEQGTVFVAEDWTTVYRKQKNVTGTFTGDPDSVSWTTMTKKDYEGCTRTILMMENVLLGDIRQYDMDKQPYLALVFIKSRAEAEAIYGGWKRWKDVPLECTKTLGDGDALLYTPFHLFEATQKTEVEIIKYMDKWNNEYAVLINGVLMTPPEFPLSAMTPKGEYMVEKQVFEPISPFFAYGKSLGARMKPGTAILDEMYRLAILKTQKSFAPPMANNTGKVLSSRIFAPGKMTMGIDPERIKPLDPNGRPVEAGEFQMIKMLQDNLNTNTLDPVFSGQQPQGTPTATQILEVQRQAKMMIGLTVFVCAMLEQKLSWLRIQNVLANWFKPMGKSMNPYTGEYIDKYRSVNIEKNIPGAGLGRKLVRIAGAKEMPSDLGVYQMEEALSTRTTPVRITYLNADEICKAEHMWYVTVVPKEKRTDALSKMLFDEMAQKAMGFPHTNITFLEELFAETWEQNPNKLFNFEAPGPTTPTEAAAQANGTPMPGMPQNTGTPKNMMNMSAPTT